MTDPQRLPGEDGSGDADGTDPERSPATPRWVKLLAVAGAVIVVLVLTVILLGGGAHGPGRHVPEGETTSMEISPARDINVT